jgi:maleate cis-trans isomerase
MGKLESHPHFTRRSFTLSAAGAGLCAAASSALDLISGPAKASNYRGVVGDIKPRANDSALVDMIKILPEGIGVIPVYLNLTQGTREEYGSAYGTYEKLIAYLAAQKCDLISIEGAPPFMLLGPDGEKKMVDGWKDKYKTDMFTSSQNQVNAMRALKVKKILGITSGSGGPELNKIFAKYFEDCGIGVVAMEGMGVKFKDLSNVPTETIAAFHQAEIRRAQRRGCGLHPGFGAGSAALDRANRTRIEGAGRSGRRRAHLGNRAPLEGPCAHQGLRPLAGDPPGIMRPS